jgi:LPS export ABC transporter protein LptC
VEASPGGGVVRRGIHILTLALLLTLPLYLSCEGVGDDGRSVYTEDVPDQEFTDFTTVESDSGIVKWVLSAPVARVYNASKLLVTDDPRIEFYNEDGTLASVLLAKKGEYNQVTHDLTALGDVIVTSSEGYTLETESLVWVEKLEEIHTEDFVRFIKGEDVLTGYGFRSDPNLENVEIMKDVKAYLRDDEGLVDEEVRKETDGGEER